MGNAKCEVRINTIRELIQENEKREGWGLPDSVPIALLSPRDQRKKKEYPPGKTNRHTTYTPCFSKKYNSLKNFQSLLYHLS